MTYEGIEFAIRAGLGRNEWVATIHFPDANEPLARSSMVKVTGTRDEAIALTQVRIHNWQSGEWEVGRIYETRGGPDSLHGSGRGPSTVR